MRGGIRMVLVALAFVGAMASYADDWHAQWIWAARDHYDGYNDTIEARRTFEWPAVKSASLRVTADTVYRVSINGEWVKASSSDVFEVMSSGTGELYATVPQGTADEANRAVEAAAGRRAGDDFDCARWAPGGLRCVHVESRRDCGMVMKMGGARILAHSCECRADAAGAS